MNCSRYIFFKKIKPLISISRHRHKLKSDVKESVKVSSDVVKYLESSNEYEEIRDKIPKYLLRKYSTPESMYLINKKTASEVANILKEHLCTGPVIEVNPGFGFLSKELLNNRVKHLHLYESSSSFAPLIKPVIDTYKKRVTYKESDLFGMWKLAFQDKMDNGNRVKELLGDLATTDDARVVKIVGAMPGLSFVKHLVNTIIFHNSHNQLGRPDLYIAIPKHHYEFLTDGSIQTTKHRSLAALFQLLFDCKVLSKLSKIHYLPWMHPPKAKKATVLDEHLLYLVNITQKEKLPCKSEHLPLLWYFFKPHMMTKSTRVIPMLEQWIPGCGVWLITGQDPPDSDPLVGPSRRDAALPHMTIFTEYGELTLAQKITAFKRFISWPEFEHCPFKVTMENNLPKYITAINDDDDDSKRRLATPIDDDSEISDTE